MNDTTCLKCTTQNCENCPKKPKNKCGMKTEIFSRVCGYHRPVKNWNKGKQEEFKERRSFKV